MNDIPRAVEPSIVLDQGGDAGLAERWRAIDECQMDADAERGSGRLRRIASAVAGALAKRLALVTIPPSWASKMPSLTPTVRPKSSALTIQTAQHNQLLGIWKT